MSNYTIKFWGVRGTIPVPGASTLKYGGNTSCVQFSCGDAELIMDAGTGIVNLWRELRQRQVTEVDLLLSHTHLDHIMGLPNFGLLQQSGATIHLWAGHLKPKYTLEEVLSRILADPIYPLTLNDMKANIVFHDFVAGEQLNDPRFAKRGIVIKTFPLHHPDNATAYRVEYLDKSACYMTDVEPQAQHDQELVDFSRGVDLIIRDSTYDNSQRMLYAGWGHSTWQDTVAFARETRAGRIVLFHHDPDINDDALDERGRNAKILHENSVVAREGLSLKL